MSSSLHDQVDYWAHYAGRPVTKFEQLVIARPFKYDAYWHTWDRILKPVWAGEPRGLVEVALTPVNGFTARNDNAVKEIKEMRIRNHLTTSDKNDKYASSLPENVRQLLIDKIGADETQYLLYGNIWEAISWPLYAQAAARIQGGGVPLAQCRKYIGSDSTREFDERNV